jgi:queuine tRNA-ribosyltransferase
MFEHYKNFKFTVAFNNAASPVDASDKPELLTGICNVNNGRARLGKLQTPHGTIDTPSFVFCGTKATVKGLDMNQVRDAKTQIVLSNTYHLMLQPGPDIIAKHGGLHKFMDWHGPIMTDSGGFQIFSLGHGSVANEIKGNGVKRDRSLVKITREGAYFRSYINGQKYFLSPEKSMEIQKKLGADLCFTLDECTPFHVDKRYTEKSMHMSHDWEKRSLEAFQQNDDGKQALYGIVQGGIYHDLRAMSCDFVAQHEFFGNAIGGSLGGSVEQMREIVEMTSAMLHNSSFHRPIHLLGIGKVRDIIHGVINGIDTFDCVHPTRIARHGGALVMAKTKRNLMENPCPDNELSIGVKSKPKPILNRERNAEFINLNNARFREDLLPIEEGCQCQTCKLYTRSYIHHLIKADEILGVTAITLHNVHYMNKLMAAIRDSIAFGHSLQDLLTEWV